MKKKIILMLVLAMVLSFSIVSYAIESPEMVTVSSGTAADGSTSIGYDIEMGKYEVTQAEYESVMGNNPSEFYGDNKPVESISWYDAVEYCNKLSEQEGLTPAYDTSGDKDTWSLKDDPQNLEGYRLPTETEWEYAARGGADGNNTIYAGSDNIDEVAWYDDNSGEKTHPVGEKQANELGIYDMSGNVYEWTNPPSGSYRVYRGGGWDYDANICEVDSWSNITPSNSFNFVLGFRLTKTK